MPVSRVGIRRHREVNFGKDIELASSNVGLLQQDISDNNAHPLCKRNSIHSALCDRNKLFVYRHYVTILNRVHIVVTLRWPGFVSSAFYPQIANSHCLVWLLSQLQSKGFLSLHLQVSLQRPNWTAVKWVSPLIGHFIKPQASPV